MFADEITGQYDAVPPRSIMYTYCTNILNKYQKLTLDETNHKHK